MQTTISGCATYTNTVDRAKKLISNANIRSTTDSDLQFALQQFNQNNFTITEFYLKKKLVKFPDNPTSVKLLPWAYFYQKRYDKALKAFERTKTHYRKKPEQKPQKSKRFLTNKRRSLDSANVVPFGRAPVGQDQPS